MVVTFDLPPVRGFAYGLNRNGSNWQVWAWDRICRLTGSFGVRGCAPCCGWSHAWQFYECDLCLTFKRGILRERACLFAAKNTIWWVFLSGCRLRFVAWRQPRSPRVVYHEPRVLGSQYTFPDSNTTVYCRKNLPFFSNWHKIDVFQISPVCLGAVNVKVFDWWLKYESSGLLYVLITLVLAYCSRLCMLGGNVHDQVIAIARTENWWWCLRHFPQPANMGMPSTLSGKRSLTLTRVVLSCLSWCHWWRMLVVLGSPALSHCVALIHLWACPL